MCSGAEQLQTDALAVEAKGAALADADALEAARHAAARALGPCTMDAVH